MQSPQTPDATTSAPSSPDPTAAARRRLLYKVGVATTLYYLLVIMWGSWVRIAGAGAGCGEHWPLCNGDVIPDTSNYKTFIEYGHRVTSAIAGPLGIVLVWLAFRCTPKGEWRVRAVALVHLALLGVEALLGRMLVKKGLVVNDDSATRAIVMGIHLVNTYALVAATALTAFWGRAPTPRSQRTPIGGLLWFAVLAIVVVSASGAVTALGDTIFPPDQRPTGGFFARFADAFDPSQHFLLRLLVLHPILSILGGAVLITAAVRRTPAAFARPVVWAVSIQLVFGVLNVVLKAPGWAQLVHLTLAELVWLALVLAIAARRDLPSGATATALRPAVAAA